MSHFFQQGVAGGRQRVAAKRRELPPIVPGFAIISTRHWTITASRVCKSSHQAAGLLALRAIDSFEAEQIGILRWTCGRGWITLQKFLTELFCSTRYETVAFSQHLATWLE